mgnify:CR=1 FL=1
MKHTPGPWEIREVAHEATAWHKRRVYRAEIIAPQYLYEKRTHSRGICQIVDYCDWTDHPGNAALIAAAPDMLASLKRQAQGLHNLIEFNLIPASHFPDTEKEASQLEALIDKAEGRS